MATIEELEARLEVAKTELVCADMIDSPARRDIQTRYWRERVAALEADLLDTRAGFNPYGSGPVPIEPREGIDAEMGAGVPAVSTLESRLADCLADIIDTPLLTGRDECGWYSSPLEIRLAFFRPELSERAADLLEEAGR